jgi:hypothetical protein
MLLQCLEFGSLGESAWLRTLMSKEFRPNLLIVCSNAAACDAAVQRLLPACTPPTHQCELPGALHLPERRTGTLLLKHVDALTLRQQIALHDWINEGRGELQILSVTAVPLERLVYSGGFLDGLFYRLNVVRLDAG